MNISYISVRGKSLMVCRPEQETQVLFCLWDLIKCCAQVLERATKTLAISMLDAICCDRYEQGVKFCYRSLRVGDTLVPLVTLENARIFMAYFFEGYDDVKAALYVEVDPSCRNTLHGMAKNLEDNLASLSAKTKDLLMYTRELEKEKERVRIIKPEPLCTGCAGCGNRVTVNVGAQLWRPL